MDVQHRRLLCLSFTVVLCLSMLTTVENSERSTVKVELALYIAGIGGQNYTCVVACPEPGIERKTNIKLLIYDTYSIFFN